MSFTDINKSGTNGFHGMIEAALDEKARVNGLIETDAVGQSMYPTIVSGDRIVIDRTKIEELKAGDIIAFGKDSLLICHRIKEIREKNGRKYFITAGDAHEKADNFEVEVNEIAGKVIKIIKRPARSYYLSYLKKSAKAVLEFLGIRDLSKEAFYRLIKKRIRYHLSVPRTGGTHPAYKFINAPLENIVGGYKEFFAPSDSIGRFKIVATLGKYRAATMEFHKLSGGEKPEGLWAPAGPMTSQIFSHTGLETDLWEAARSVLDKVNSGLERKPQFKIRPGYPFVSLFRWILMSLQRLPFYRKSAKWLFYRHIRFSSKEERPGSRRFLATMGRFVMGSVSLVERKDEAGSSKWWLYSLQVSILLRGSGIGEELMNRLADFAKSRNIRTLYLAVRYDRDIAIGLYKKMGFVKVCTDRYGLVLMEKSVECRGRA